MKKKSLSILTFFTVLTLLVPQIVLATPLTGADTDVTVFIDASQQADTTDATDDNEDGDVNWPFNTFSNMHIGGLNRFEAIYFDISSGGFGSGNPTMQYWNGATWETLAGTWSQSDPFTHAEIINFTFTTVPEGWATRSLSGFGDYYYVQIGSSGAQGASVDQISLLSEGAGGGGAGEGIPEFTDFLYLLTLVSGAWYIYSRIAQKDSTEGGAA